MQKKKLKTPKIVWSTNIYYENLSVVECSFKFLTPLTLLQRFIVSTINQFYDIFRVFLLDYLHYTSLKNPNSVNPKINAFL
jgi:hypothetical protein